MKKALCAMVIGKKYKNMFLISNIVDYAEKCSAELVLIDEPLDKEFKRGLLYQKLLIPAKLTNYDLVCFLDIDIVISKDAPSIFNCCPVDKSFGAVLDPRGSPEYVSTWKVDRVVKETTADYFISRGFATNDPSLLEGSINSGVLLFRPEAVCDVFADYYYSDHDQGLHSTDEAPMAFLTQTNGEFFSLDQRYNCQIIYKLHGGNEDGEAVIDELKKTPLKHVNKLYRYIFRKSIIPTNRYNNLINKLLMDNYIIHFAGKYPIPKLVNRAL